MLCQPFLVVVHPLAHLQQAGEIAVFGLRLHRQKRLRWEMPWQSASRAPSPNHSTRAYVPRWPLPPSLLSCYAFHQGGPPSCPATDLHLFVPHKPTSTPMELIKAFLGTPAPQPLFLTELTLQVCLLQQSFPTRGKGLYRIMTLYPPVITT